MNIISFKSPFKQWRDRLMFHSRFFDVKTRTNSFSTRKNTESIQRIYVINLDRRPDRWRQISKELRRIRNRLDKPLSSITRRFSAIDARYLNKESVNKVLRADYSLADQLLVEPDAKVCIDVKSRSHRIDMTPQEIAIALSHIEVWKLVASSDISYTLILEDDVYFRQGFCKNIDDLWHTAVNQSLEGDAFDLLYLSFQEVGLSSLVHKPATELVHKPNCGIWQASGYVLSRAGAKKLVELLPAYGPIDLWMNLQFKKLDVLVAQRPIIEQRIDVLSTNSYSIMPVLSQIGVYAKEKPIVPQIKKLSGPIFVYGEPGSGLTALAKALSMLGYTCCSDLTNLTKKEHGILLSKKRGRIFNAYVNVGSIDYNFITEIAKIYPDARFIFTTQSYLQSLPTIGNQVLYLPHEGSDKWEALSEFLELEHPSFPYPFCNDIGQRDVIKSSKQSKNILPFKHLKFDSSPWTVSLKKCEGVNLNETKQKYDFKSKIVRIYSESGGVDQKLWKLRDDTFPSNLALFTPKNVRINDSLVTCLTLRKQNTAVRDFTSGAIVTRRTYLFGRFSVNLRPSNVSGLVTGIFLHRNNPYQEIDIEFLGKDTTKMLINVFYNPGIEGTKLEYGYRGTPTLVDLGFDAAKEFHQYAIEWNENSIRWFVDEVVIHERVLWNPTPIPNLPMEFNINLWHSRSKQLSGNLDVSLIPSQTQIKAIHIMQRDVEIQ